jgi:CheY-like chemotaxis protein
VLLAEDNPVNQLLMTQYFLNQGVHVQTVADGLRRGDAVAAAGAGAYDVVLCDIEMPWRRGVGTAAAARWPQFLAANRRRALPRVARLRALRGLQVFDERPGTTGSWPLLLVAMPDAHSADAALAQLWGAGLGVSRPFAHALPDYARYADRVPRAAMPNARDFARRALTISNSAWLDERGFERICAVLETVLTRGTDRARPAAPHSTRAAASANARADPDRPAAAHRAPPASVCTGCDTGTSTLRP